MKEQSAVVGPTALADLPLDLQSKIASHLGGADLFETFRNLHALSATSKVLREAVTGNDGLHYGTLRAMVHATDALMSSASNQTLYDASNFLGMTLVFASPGQRERMVNAVLGIEGEIDKARALVGLCKGMPHLSEMQRERVVAAAIGFDDEPRSLSAFRCSE